MNYSKRMYFIDCIADLLDNRSHLSFLHWLSSFELMKKLPTCPNLEYDEDMLFVLEISIHFDDVGMVQIKLYF